jgi:anti-sigma factor RsiW
MSNNHQNHLDDCDPILELIPEYAFGLTDTEESRRLEAAIPGCPEAAAALSDYRQLQAELRASVPAVEPWAPPFRPRPR